MEAFIYLINIPVLILGIFSIGFYFEIKGLDSLRDFDFDKDIEIFEELGFGDSEDLDNDITEKTRKKRFRLRLSFVLFIAVSVVSVVLVVINHELFSARDVLTVTAIICLIFFLYFVDEWLNLRELKKMTDYEYRNLVAEKNKRLAPIRVFYIISAIIIIVAFLIVQTVYNLEQTNNKLYNLLLSFLLIYHGGMGLIAQTMFLRLPFRPHGKLQPYINLAIVVLGMYLLIESLMM